MIKCPICQDPVVISRQFGTHDEYAEDDDTTHSFFCRTRIEVEGGRQWLHFTRRVDRHICEYFAHVKPFRFHWRDNVITVTVQRWDKNEESVEFVQIYQTKGTLDDFYQAIVRVPKLSAFI